MARVKELAKTFLSPVDEVGANPVICLSEPVEVKQPSKNSRKKNKVKAENKENPG